MNKKNQALWKWLIVTICCAVLAFVIPIVTTAFLAEESEPVVIVLDPGHGGADMGAISSDGTLYESDLNLAIALACYDELQKYAGIEVYMTHSGVDYSRTLSLNDRIDYVNAVGGDILVSLHCNDSTNLEASGAEVYVSHSTFKQSYNQDSTQLAIEFLKQFRQIGMNIRGVKTRLSNGSRMYYHEDGTEEIGDYYAVIGGTIKKYGIPGILVEHGFVTGDQQYLNSPEDLKAFGYADAMAIVEYYDLKLKTETTQDTGSTEEAVIITDQDVASAADISTRLANVAEQPAITDYTGLQQLRGEYERLSFAAKTLVDQSLVETLYKAILDLDGQMYPIRLVETADTELSINRLNHTITGLYRATDGLSGTNAAALVASLTTYIDPANAAALAAGVADTDIIISDPDGQAMDVGQQVGTGCEARLIRGSETLDRLFVVIPCDLSGDGVVDSLDQMLLENYLFNGAALTEAQLCAADVDADGSVDADDVTALIYEILRNE